MPFFVLAAEAGIVGVDRRFEEVALTLGARPRFVVVGVVLRLASPALGAGMIVAWARALGEFGATITFAGNIEGRTQTLPLAVYVLLESDPQAAFALSIVLIAIAIGVLVALRGRYLGGTK
jgi:molybdate transport system permease protein